MPKFKLVKGGLKIEIEQDESVTTDYLEKLFALIDTLPQVEPVSPKQEFQQKSSKQQEQKSDLTLNSIISKINARSLKEILEAAAYYSHIRSSDAIFSKSDWENNAASALRWEKGMVKNRATYIKRAIDAGTVIEKAGERFALSPDFEQSMKNVLSN